MIIINSLEDVLKKASPAFIRDYITPHVITKSLKSGVKEIQENVLDSMDCITKLVDFRTIQTVIFPQY